MLILEVKSQRPMFNEACTHGCQGGVPLKSGYFFILACPAWKWLQIHTNMLLIITSAGYLLF